MALVDANSKGVRPNRRHDRPGVLARNGRARICSSFNGYNGSDDPDRAADALIAEWPAAGAS